MLMCFVKFFCPPRTTIIDTALSSIIFNAGETLKNSEVFYPKIISKFGVVVS